MARRISPTLVFVLKGLMPYTRENLMLSFSPNKFFNELERIGTYSRPQIRNAYYRARKNDFISDDPLPKLTAKGKQKLQPFIATKLAGNARLMVIFDIPEEKAELRQRFRTLLRELKFELAQHSVWVTDFDHQAVIIEAVGELGLENYVQVHESALLFPRH